MRVLVLGGAGLIGNAIVRSLVAGGYRVTAAGRRTTRPLNLVGVEADYAVADVADTAKLGALISGHDVVVDAAAPYALNLFHAATAAERHPIEHAATRTAGLVHGVREHGAALVYVGTPRSLAEGGASAAQRRFVHKLQPYFEMKRLIEQQILEAASRGLRTIFLRPSASFGPWDIKPRAQCWVPALLRSEIPMVLQHRVNVVDTRDVADTLLRALRSGDFGADIQVSGHNTSVAGLFTLVCELADVRPPRWSVPAAAGILPTLWAEFGWALLGQPSPLPSLVPMLLCEQQWEAADSTRTLRPLTETARAAIDWYRKLGYC
jgi:dihydroflavonol-4-reductase